jgi:hypothetical protein
VRLCELEGHKVRFLHEQLRRLQQRVAQGEELGRRIAIKKVNSLELLKRPSLIPDSVRQGMAMGQGVLFCDPPFIREKAQKASLDFWRRFFRYLEQFCQGLSSLTQYPVAIMVHLPQGVPLDDVLPPSWSEYGLRQYGSQRLLITEGNQGLS